MNIGCNIWMICLKLNWFFLQTEAYIATFWICMYATFFSITSGHEVEKIIRDKKIRICGDGSFSFWLMFAESVIIFVQNGFCIYFSFKPEPGELSWGNF